MKLSPQALDMFDVYKNVLQDWNSTRVNLTAITKDEDIALKHFIDSLEAAQAVDFSETNLKIIDVGTGAGFPGIPLKIAFPNIQLTLLDSQKKRALFLAVLLGRLGLQDVAVFNARGEELAKDMAFRECFDVAMMREFGKIPLNLEIGLPFVKVGGSLLLWKGGNDIEGLPRCEKFLNELGGRVEKIYTYKFTDTSEHFVVHIKKEWNTPQKYPRTYSSMLRSLNRL